MIRAGTGLRFRNFDNQALNRAIERVHIERRSLWDDNQPMNSNWEKSRLHDLGQ